ncbi:hypothetical protein BH24ACT2_BH24ACT2_05480 [soil metagenome]
MGKKVFVGCAGARPPAEVFRSGITSDSSTAPAVLARLYNGRMAVLAGPSTLDFTIFPQDGRRYVGAYGDDTIVLCDYDLSSDDALVSARTTTPGHALFDVMLGFPVEQPTGDGFNPSGSAGAVRPPAPEPLLRRQRRR